MLLLDENLSPRLVKRLENDFPGLKHVLHLSLDNEKDSRIWTLAKEMGFTIVSKDRDYLEFAHRFGHPPKFIWLTLGNCQLQVLEAFLKSNKVRILDFLAQVQDGILKL